MCNRLELAGWIGLGALLIACGEPKSSPQQDAAWTDGAVWDGAFGLADARQGGVDARLVDATIGDPTVGPVTNFSSGTLRRHAALAQLQDGRVLVAGGITAPTAVELYDVNAETIQLVDPLNEGRRYASATLLPDGTVLVLGGTGSATDGTAAEIFDPSDGSNTLLTARMGSARANHGAWLLSLGIHAGKVLIAGGAVTAAPELYDPVAKTFAPLGATTPPPFAAGLAVLLSDERVLFLGATSSDQTHFRDCYLYDPIAGAFAKVASLANDRNRYQPVALKDGRVLIAGGYDDVDDASAVTDIEIFDPMSGNMTTLGTGLPGPRYLNSAARLGSGRVALISGVAAPSNLIDTVDIFDPITDTVYAAEGQVGLARANSSALSLTDGRIFVLGGQVVIGSNTFDTSNVDLVSE